MDVAHREKKSMELRAILRGFGCRAMNLQQQEATESWELAMAEEARLLALEKAEQRKKAAEAEEAKSPRSKGAVTGDAVSRK